MDSQTTKQIYNQDVIENGGYLYTGKQIYSARIATQKQTDEIHNLLKKYFSYPITILDVGCGDGVYTLELLQHKNIQKITAFDIADKAIVQAKKILNPRTKNTVNFQIGDVYQMSEKYHPKEFTLAIFRGVLHHLEKPTIAIEQISKICDNVIILEPNGYNPILKIIEKFSPYHIRHGEKSYLPINLNNWFRKSGYKNIYTKYFSIVPYFFPENLVRILKLFEPFLEHIPILNKIYCGGIVVLYQKSAGTS